MRKLITALFAASVATAACAQPISPAASSGPPKLLVVISVDQLSADLWDEYGPHFTGGLARIASGATFRNGYQSHATTETCLGHSTILTGARPSRTGIVGNLWFDPNAPRADKDIYCAEDETVPGSSSSNYTVSPKHLRVPTLGDLMKQRSPASLNVAVAGKDRSAVMMGGHRPDQRWYWAGDKFASDLKSAAVPNSVATTNRVLAGVLAAATPPLQPTPFCRSKAQVFPLPRGGKPVGDGALGRTAGSTGGFRATPQFDGAVLALAAGLIQEMKLGGDSSPDILSIGLAATDYVGHSYGTGGQEMCLQLLELDREIGDFLAQLDRWDLDYAVVLTADHGGLDIPERLRAKGVADAAWVDLALTPPRLDEAVGARTGLNGRIVAFGGPSGDIFLDPALSATDRAKASDALLSIYRANPQVEAVYTKAEIARTAPPTGSPVNWSMLERVRASFDPERSGDLYVVLKPHIQPIADTSRYVSTHGSPWDYDRRVPMIFWRPGMATSPSDAVVETTDIMPTLAAWLGVPITPGSLDGHCLPSVATCPGVAAAPERGER
ncbi:MAG TPA: alkaline phosphatase family protein [Sphingomicrobium sp.]|nr:alkaline phosphatase family protein [Sphingomicrobium sp.]